MFFNLQRLVGHRTSEIKKIMKNLNKFFALLERKPKMNLEGKVVPHNLDGKLEFKNVSFTYPSRPETQVLKVILKTILTTTKNSR